MRTGTQLLNICKQKHAGVNFFIFLPFLINIRTNKAWEMTELDQLPRKPIKPDILVSCKDILRVNFFVSISILYFCAILQV